jgi:hypothetical protein
MHKENAMKYILIALLITLPNASYAQEKVPMLKKSLG